MKAYRRTNAFLVLVLITFGGVASWPVLAQAGSGDWFMLLARGDVEEVEEAIAGDVHLSVPSQHRFLDVLVVAQYTSDPDVARTVAQLASTAGISAAWFDIGVIVAAAMNHSPAVLNALVDAGGAPSARYEHGWTPLHYAAAREEGLPMVETLLGLGSEPDAATHALAPPAVLEEVPGQFHRDIVTLLRDVLDVVDGHAVGRREGVTPLMVAAGFADDVRTVEALLDAGADPAARDEYDRLAIDYANDNVLFDGPARREPAYWTLNDARFQ